MQEQQFSTVKPLVSWLRIIRQTQFAIKTSLAPLALSFLWVLMITVVDPRGNFPLNDDWSYALAVKTLLEQGRLHVIDWVAATAVAQVLWGALFCLPFGFSFEALRASSLIMGWVGVMAAYGLLRESPASRPVAFFGAALVATNPLYFQLSNTYMTDIPFFAMTMLSLLIFCRGLRSNRQLEILAAAVLACLAMLIRQMGIVVPLSFALAYLVFRGGQPRHLFCAVYPTLLAVLALGLYQFTQGFSDNYGHVNLPAALQLSPNALVWAFLVNSFIAFAYLGLFLLPFLMFAFPLLWSRLFLRAYLVTAGVLAGLFVFLIRQGRFMPLLAPHGNLLMKSGLGPTPLRDNYLEIRHLPELPDHLWGVLTAGSLLGAILLVGVLLMMVRNIVRSVITSDFAKGSPNSSQIILLGLTCLLYSAPLTITGFYDRYLIPLLPPLMSFVIMAASSLKVSVSRWQTYAASSLLLLYVLFTLGATHDYFSWNRARWEALQYLTGSKMNISAREIDGGYEFNGWYNYDADYQARPEKSYWWVENDEFIVAFGPVPGYERIKSFSYPRWIPLQQDHIFVFRKTVLVPNDNISGE